MLSMSLISRLKGILKHKAYGAGKMHELRKEILFVEFSVQHTVWAEEESELQKS